MHESTYRLVEGFVRSRKWPDQRVLDVGSFDVNGTYKPIFGGWHYVGLDIVAGPNVDVVATDQWPVGRFPLIVAGQVLEHVERPWLFVPQAASHLEPGGWLLVVAPFIWEHHRHPIDCWRFAPDGLKVLAKDAGLIVVESGLRKATDPKNQGWIDCYAWLQSPS